jgi:hypothetical protein
MSIQDTISKLIKLFSPQKLVEYIAELVEEVNSLKTENKNLNSEVQKYKDELNRLKGEQAKPEFKKNEPAGNKHLPKNKKELGESKGRENNKKSRKVDRLIITSEQVVPDKRIKRSKGYKDIIIQDINFSTSIIKYRLECGFDKDNNFITAKLPIKTHGEFGIGILSFVKMLYYQCRVPMDKIHLVLKNFKIIIGKSVVVNMCHFLNDKMKKELDHARGTSIAKSKVVQMDDTGAMVNYKNQHTFTLSTEHVTMLTTIDSKSMMSAMYAYTGGQRVFYVINNDFLFFLKKLLNDEVYQKYFKKFKRFKPYSEEEFNKIMEPYSGERMFHRAYKMRICAIRAWIKTHPKNIPEAVLVTDDAGNFKFMGHNHQLCWVHEIRHYRKLEAMTNIHRELRDQILVILYDFYKKLKLFKEGKISKLNIQADFDLIKEIKTGFKELDDLIANTKKREHGLLAVLRYPFAPLQNNLCEQDLRENVIKRKVSGGTKTKLGTYSWDVGLSLVHTCRKLKISFYDYLKDRYSKAHQIPKLQHLVLAS